MRNSGKTFAYLLLARRRHSEDLSAIRESYGQVNQQLFELCCKLQKHFDPKDLQQASFLAAELNTLKACEEKLEELDSLRDGVAVVEGKT